MLISEKLTTTETVILYNPTVTVLMCPSPVWCIALISLVISVDTNVTDGHFASKLDVDKVWLWPIRLPVRVQ